MYQRIKDKIRDRLLTFQVKDLFNTIDEDDILKRVGTNWTVKGKPITKQELELLQAEAEIFMKSKLWRVLKKDICYRANLSMYQKAKDKSDLTAGKLWLYTLDCIETKLINLTK